jgi:hypothetical protein
VLDFVHPSGSGGRAIDQYELERVFTPKAKAGDAEAAKLVKQVRRQRARTAKLILQRAPTSRPM